MSEPKNEGVNLGFTSDQMEKTAEEQENDPISQKERKNFQDAKMVAGAETLEKQFGISSQVERNFEAWKLAQKFGLKGEAEQQVNYMREFFENAPNKVQENRDVLKTIFAQIAAGSGYIVNRKNWKDGDFDIFKKFCESTLGKPAELTEKESEKLNLAPDKSNRRKTLLRVDGTNCVFIWYPGLTADEDVFSANIWDKESLAKLEEIPSGKFSS